MGDGCLFHLANWAVRKLSQAVQGLPAAKDSAGALGLGCTALTIARYLVDYGRRHNPSLMYHLTQTLDILGLTARLLLISPWQSVFEGNPAAGSKALLLQPDIQAWLLMHSALMDDDVRARLDLRQESKREELGQLAFRLTNTVIAHVPVLRSLHTFLHAAATWQEGTHHTGGTTQAPMVVALVDSANPHVAFTEKLGVDKPVWEAARATISHLIAQTAHNLSQPSGRCLLHSLAEAMEQAWLAQEQPDAAHHNDAQSQPTSVGVDIYRCADETAKDWRWWSSLQYTFCNDDPAESIRLASGCEGLRYSLEPLATPPGTDTALGLSTTGAVPCHSKMCVVVAGREPLEAELQVAGSETK